VYVKNDKARKDYKMKLLMENQETLFAITKMGTSATLSSKQTIPWHGTVLY
jgi:hypothetical protein